MKYSCISLSIDTDFIYSIIPPPHTTTTTTNTEEWTQKSSSIDLHPQPYIFSDRVFLGYPRWPSTCHPLALASESLELQVCTITPDYTYSFTYISRSFNSASSDINSQLPVGKVQLDNLKRLLNQHLQKLLYATLLSTPKSSTILYPD